MAQELGFTPEVEAATQPIYERVRHVIPEVEWPVHAPYVALINELKAERNAVLLAHNYQTPEIYHGVADYTGDCATGDHRLRRLEAGAGSGPAHCIAMS